MGILSKIIRRLVNIPGSIIFNIHAHFLKPSESKIILSDDSIIELKAI